MIGLFRILLFIFLGYIIVKTFRFIMSVFTAVNGKKNNQKVYDTSSQKTKIDKKDIIDAQFEEIDVKDNSSSKE